MDELILNKNQTDNHARKKTENKAIQLLLNKGDGFLKPTPQQKKNIVIACAMLGKVVYGKAFDLIKVKGNIDLSNVEEIRQKFENIVLYELKSTNKVKVKEDFENYFFGLTTAELLVAQNLKNKYKFILVNLSTETIMEMTLNEIMAKAKGIYPSWSIQF